MSNHRYVPIAPARLAMASELGLAVFLHDFLVERQTDGEGRVFYGHAITYRWILANWPEDPKKRPKLRTLRKYMGILKAAGLLELRRAGGSNGMRIRLLGSVKWPAEIPPPAVQLSLFAPAPTPIRRPGTSGKTVDKLLETGGNPVQGQKESGTSVPLSPPRVARMCP